MLAVIIIGVCISIFSNKGPQGTYVCNDDIFGYTIKFDGKTAYMGTSVKGKVILNGMNVTVRYSDGTSDRYVYHKEDDYLTDENGILKWYKQK